MTFRKGSSGSFLPPPLKRAGGELLSENQAFIDFSESLEKKMASDYLALQRVIGQPDGESNIVIEKSTADQNSVKMPMRSSSAPLKRNDNSSKIDEKGIEVNSGVDKSAAYQNFMKMYTQSKSEPLKRSHSGPKNAFKQEKIISELDESNPKHKPLIKLDRKYGGLCEIISNFVIANDLLGKKDDSLVDAKKFFFSTSPNTLQMSINLDGISEEKIRNSHIVETSNIFAKLAAIVFNIHPYSIIPNRKEILLGDKESGREINSKQLEKQLNKLATDDYIKFEVFKQDGINFSGHSMVIKKTGNDLYSFFNPDEGEYQNLKFKELCELINAVIKRCEADRVAFIDGNKYLIDLGLIQKKAGKTPNL